MKPILYVDMDGVIVDFESAFDKLDPAVLQQYDDRQDEIPGIFSLMDPMPGGLESFNELSSVYDTYILSSPSWNNPSSWSDKALWVQKYLGDVARKRLILSHHKHLSAGSYLIDDRIQNGAGEFTGEHIHFGTSQFPDWNAVLEYLL